MRLVGPVSLLILGIIYAPKSPGEETLCKARTLGDIMVSFDTLTF